MLRQVIGYYGNYRVKWLCSNNKHNHKFKWIAWLCELVTKYNTGWEK